MAVHTFSAFPLSAVKVARCSPETYAQKGLRQLAYLEQAIFDISELACLQIIRLSLIIIIIII
jgi:hypothetical protein